uniref:Uncharacterized protein n=1 Tax=Ditylenchus dipsaci TaxID=166011 RepID=A0A915E1D9_9BILA
MQSVIIVALVVVVAVVSAQPHETCTSPCATGQFCIQGSCVTPTPCTPACFADQICMKGACEARKVCADVCVEPQHCNPHTGTCMTPPEGMQKGGPPQ